MSLHAKAANGGSPSGTPAPGPSSADARDALAARLRVAFAGRDVREVRMFGGVSFMVDERMAVAAGPRGDLLVRIDPARHEQLLAVPGARHAVMGTDRPMGPGWIRVEHAHVEADERLSFWIRTALECHATQRKGAP